MSGSSRRPEKPVPASDDPDSADSRALGRGTLGVRAGAEGSGSETRRMGVRARFHSRGLKPRRERAEQGAPGPAHEQKDADTRSGRKAADEGEAVRREQPRPEQERLRSEREQVRAEREHARPKRGKKPVERAPARERSRARSAPPGRSVLPQSDPTPPATGALPIRPDGVRLSKIMAERGICSRREADQIIERGWVFVNGHRVSELGTRISPDAQISLAPEATRRQAAQVTILLHKPVGYVSGQPEPGFEPAVSLIGADNQFDRAVAQRFHRSHLRGLAPAGRLDIDSTGLLVLTQNGRIARQLIGEDSKIDKEYIVRVEGRLEEGGLALLAHGLELDGRKLRQALVEWINDDQLRFVLREGRKRQIRRMCELVGLNVVGLKRTRIGRVRLGELPVGEWRFLRDDERF